MRRAASAAQAALASAAVCAVLLLTGCGLWRPTTVPMRTLAEPAQCPTRPDTLLVLLPGRFSLPEEFVQNGFIEAVRAHHIAADMLLADAHLGYYTERSIVDRLQADVIRPARAQGYAHVWLVGISLGAYGAFINTVAQPAGIDGIVAFAPYLGAPRVIADIAKAGGLRAWRPPAAAPEDGDAALWRWLQQETAAPAASQLPITLGYGREDRFLASDQLLAAALPPERVFTAEGGHDWPAWRSLWQQLLSTSPWPVDPRCGTAAR